VREDEFNQKRKEYTNQIIYMDIGAAHLIYTCIMLYLNPIVAIGLVLSDIYLDVLFFDEKIPLLLLIISIVLGMNLFVILFEGHLIKKYWDGLVWLKGYFHILIMGIAIALSILRVYNIFIDCFFLKVLYVER